MTAPENPDAAAYHRARGAVLHARGDRTGAIRCYEALVALTPDDPGAWLTLGILCRDAGDVPRALQAASRAVELDRTGAAGWLECGVLLRRLGESGQAEACYRKALELDPVSLQALFNLANVLRDRGDLAGARRLYEEALRLDGGNAEVWNNLGFAVHQMNDVEGAIRCYERATALQPGAAGTYINLGNAHRERNELDAAIAAYQTSLALDPAQPEAHHSLALALLARGDFARGWREFEWRLQCRDTGGRIGVRRFPRPLWDGSPLNGQRLLVYAEQGLGDTIQFVRFLPLLKQLGARVIFACYPHLLDLCRSLEGLERIVDVTSPTLPGFDVYAALMSIPYLTGLTRETVPGTVPYLRHGVKAPGGWTGRLQTPLFKVGLVWASNTQNTIAATKSVPLEKLLPLAPVPGVAWYSLQAGGAAAQADPLREQFPMTELPRDTVTMNDTAAAIRQMDLVVSIDTAVAHLAGALGKPVWTLLPFAADWRWMLEGDSTPWYPTMRLYRQPSPGAWEPVVRRVAEDLCRTVQASTRQEHAS